MVNEDPGVGASGALAITIQGVAVAGHLIGGELMFPLAVFLASSIGVAAVIIGATTLCNQRVPCWQGLPRAKAQDGVGVAGVGQRGVDAADREHLLEG